MTPIQGWEQRLSDVLIDSLVQQYTQIKTIYSVKIEHSHQPLCLYQQPSRNSFFDISTHCCRTYKKQIIVKYAYSEKKDSVT